MTSQLALFAPELAPRRPNAQFGMSFSVERRWHLAMSPEVAAEVMEVFLQRQGEWLGQTFTPFRAIIERHQISFCFGHALAKIARENGLEEQKVYFGKGIGADRPGSPNYHGYTVKYRLAGQQQQEDAPRAQEA